MPKKSLIVLLDSIPFDNKTEFETGTPIPDVLVFEFSYSLFFNKYYHCIKLYVKLLANCNLLILVPSLVGFSSWYYLLLLNLLFSI